MDVSNISQVMVIGLGPCDEHGNHPRYEVSTNGHCRIIDVNWIYPCDAACRRATNNKFISRCAICEVGCQQYNVVQCGEPDEYGHCCMFEVDGRMITAIWQNHYGYRRRIIEGENTKPTSIDNTVNVTNYAKKYVFDEPSDVGTCDKTVYDENYSDDYDYEAYYLYAISRVKLSIFICFVAFMMTFFIVNGEMRERDIENDIRSSYNEMNEFLRRTYLKSKSSNLISLDQTINNKELHRYIYTNENDSKKLSEVIKNIKADKAENMKKLVLGPKYNRYR